MKKLLTFEEEKRKEFLYVLFNAVFVCACIVFVLNFLVGALCGKIYSDSQIPNELLDNVLRSFLLALVLAATYIIYSLRSDIDLKTVLKPKRTSPLWFIFGTLAVTGVSFAVVILSEKAIAGLSKFGYVVNEYTPYVLGKTDNDFTSLVLVTLFSSFSGELVFRGVLTERFRRANTGLALILPAVIASAFTGSLVRMPYVFLSSIVLSWIYMKTSSFYSVFAVSFIRDASLYLFFLFKDELSDYTTIIVLAGLLAAILGLAILIIRYGWQTLYPAPRDDDDEYLRMSAKESVSGLLKAFAFWIFVFAAVFTIYFYYLSNPTVQLP